MPPSVATALLVALGLPLVACARPAERASAPVAQGPAPSDTGSRPPAAGGEEPPAQAPAAADSVRVREVPVAVGETTVALVVHEGAGSDGPAFLVLHDDEDTAIEAGLDALSQRSGRLVELRAGGERNVAFGLAGQLWRFDPNRVFTDAGARRTLLAQNDGAEPPTAVLGAVRRFAATVLDAYGAERQRAVVTLHNNTEGAYSARSYASGGEYARDAAAVHLPPGADPDDFFFVTDRALYDALVPSGFAVVLQDNARASDDGSLSVWAGQRGVPYVNVEAQHGHRSQQRAMLDALAAVLAGGR